MKGWVGAVSYNLLCEGAGLGVLMCVSAHLVVFLQIEFERAGH